MASDNKRQQGLVKIVAECRVISRKTKPTVSEGMVR